MRSLSHLLGLLYGFRAHGPDAHYFDLPTEDVHGIRGYQYEPDR